MSKVTIDIQREVNPHFKSVWKTKKPYNILRGGRNSFKSSVVVLMLAYMMLRYISKGEKANVVVIRKVGASLRDSVFLKIQWALRKFGFTIGKTGDFKDSVAPLKLTHQITGSTFYFYGQDDFQKLKSNDIGNIIGVWYEEAAEFKDAEEFDQTNTTFMRQKHPLADIVRFFWSYNPPRNPYSWINEWSDSMKGEDNYLVHDSSYKNDELGFVTEQMLQDIERIKNNDYDYYRYLYLGEPVGLGMNVYNMNLFKERETLFSDDRIIALYYSLDTGHSVSATTCGCYGLTAKGKVILLNTYYYSPAGQVKKMAPSELSEQIHMFITKTSTCEHWKGARIQKRTIDSAEAALRNQYYRDYGQHLLPVAKKKKIDMIDHVHDLLAQGRFYYLKNPFKTGMKYADSNDIFIEEHKKYQFDEKTLNSDDPKVIKEDDHTVDQFQYACVANAREWRLKG
ncbi:PBSX family phage terminase large subunit [Cytobacillus horneckiae]|uniref:PBSX family phage terminase large subunit n=1 Tax=Cytobacillus horneckiae TaxID=549687 RepID=UPI0034CE305E